MDYINDLYELCETISREINTANEKIRSAGGKITSSDMDYIDKLTHSLKSVKATIAMMEDEDANGGSYRNDGSYRGSYRGGSYARGRGSNARRDSMGRYSRYDGYSRHGDMAEELRGMMDDAPNESIKREIQRLVEKVEQM